jgi:hypothetical protein
MRKAAVKRRSDELRPEYDLRKLKSLGQGKYYNRAMAGTNLIVLEPDLARIFPDSNAVNRALRLLCDVAAKSFPKTRTAGNGRRRG